jgi:uncharacterized protein (TIGR02996 family)
MSSVSDSAGLAGAFLDDIVAHPDDVGPRLVYADWLKVRGDEELAAFIREPHGWRGRAPTREESRRDRRLMLRLMGDALPEGFGVTSGSNDGARAGLTLTESTTDPAVAPDFGGIGGRSGRVCVVVRHGFVTEVGCLQEVFLTVAAGLFRRCPVVDVRLLNKPAKVRGQGYQWVREIRPGDTGWYDALY